jgi:hypothetical protein
MWETNVIKKISIDKDWEIRLDFWPEWGYTYSADTTQTEFFEKYAIAMREYQEWIDKIEHIRFLKRVESGILTWILFDTDAETDVPFTQEMAKKELSELIPEEEREIYDRYYI